MVGYFVTLGIAKAQRGCYGKTSGSKVDILHIWLEPQVRSSVYILGPSLRCMYILGDHRSLRVAAAEEQ